jgi:hypothetical protein
VKVHAKKYGRFGAMLLSGWFSKWQRALFLFSSPTLQTHWFCASFPLIKDQKLCRVNPANCFTSFMKPLIALAYAVTERASVIFYAALLHLYVELLVVLGNCNVGVRVKKC